MNQRTEAWKAALNARCAIKAIAGIANFDVDTVVSVAKAAQSAGVHAVDVAARPELIRAARKHTDAMIFASGINPNALAEAVKAGADAVEIGNFDALYAQGVFISEAEVLKLAGETIALVQGQVMVSVTIPGHLVPESQIRLAQALEALGVDVLQTEGAARMLSAEPSVKSLAAEEKEALTLRNTKVLVQATRLPVMTASGMTADNVSRAFEAGAAAVGIGSYVNALGSEAEMAERLHAVMANRRPALVQVS